MFVGEMTTLPHYSWLPMFMREFKRLSPDQQHAFLDAVRKYVIEPLLETLVTEQLPVGFAADEIEFFHALGFDNAQIATSTERMKSLPDTPDW